MNTHRQTIVGATTVCLISLVISLALTIYSSRLLANWFTYILSVVVGVFSSSLIILISSVISLKVRKREVASSYMLPMSQLNTELELLSLFFNSNRITLESALSNTQEYSRLEDIFSQLVEKYTTILLIERMSWVSQKQYDRHINTLSKQRLPYIECTFKKFSGQAASCCTIILIMLKRHPFYNDNTQLAELNLVFHQQIAILNELVRPNGDYDKCIKEFYKIRANILKIPTSGLSD